MFAIAWEYLTGRAVATETTDRMMAEWPPHPDRVFQALVAAWGERGASQEERPALAWLGNLCNLAPPQVAAPLEKEENELGEAVRCFVPKVYVPVNDMEGPRRGNYSENHLALLPTYRTRNKRYFPAVHVGTAVCALLWPDATLPIAMREALDQLCSGVTYLGHSASLVRMWISDQPISPTWVPAGDWERRDLSLRVPDKYRLDTLITAFADGGPNWQRPPTARWLPYRRSDTCEPIMPRGQFDDRMIVMRQVEGPRLHLPQTLRLAEAMHKTLISASNGWTPELVSGHDLTGAKTRKNHIALLPLAHVGREHADGHLLGLALALPRDLAWADEDMIYRVLAAAFPHTILRLLLGRLGVVNLMIEDRPAPPYALRPGTWCRPSTRWATATPIVLDRLPPRKVKDTEAWATGQIARACTRQGLPAPAEIGLLQVSACLGSPLGRAFPAIINKEGTRRWHTHALLTFPEPVAGPLVLGAGRFRGYGLCRSLPKEVRS